MFIYFQASGLCADPFFSRFQLLMGSHEGARGHNIRLHLCRWGGLRAPWSMQRWFLCKVHNTFPHAIWPQGVGRYGIYPCVCMHMVCKFYENSKNCIQKRCAQIYHRDMLDLMVEFWALEGSLGVPRGSLWGVLGPMVDQGSPREALGGLGAVWGVSLGSSKSSTLGGEFVDGLTKYWCFQFRVVLWNGGWLLDYATFYCFSKLLLLRNREVNSLVILVESEDWQVESLSQMKKIHDRKVEFGRWIVGSQSEGNHTKTNRILMIYAFAFCADFEWITKCDAFAGKWKSEY